MKWKSKTFSERDIASYVRSREVIDCDDKFSVQSLVEIPVLQAIAFAFLYFVLAKLSQNFAIYPGNVSPIWLPSGVMFALVLKYGVGIWPSVFIGAMVGNVSSYMVGNELADVLAAGLFNGVGDVLCIVASGAAIYHITKTNNPLHFKAHFAYFVIIGVILGPFISALFGVFGLSAFGFVDVSVLKQTFFTWWIGDAVGVLVVAPLVISWLNKELIQYKDGVVVTWVVSLTTCLGTAAVFDLIIVPIELLFVSTVILPLLLVAMVHFGQRVLFTAQFFVVSIAVWATSNDLGPFALEDSNMALVQLQWFIAIFSCSVFGLAVVTYEHQNAKEVIFDKMHELENLYRTDNLTGVANRHLINEFIASEFSRMARTKVHFGVILIDLDDFKYVNDEFGHNVGDQVLIQMCNAIKPQIRTNDLLGRWGGEEFIVICDNIDQEGLLNVAEKIRKVVEGTRFQNFLRITISLGLTLAGTNDSIKSLTKRADDGLYESKRNGKNRVTYSSIKDNE